MGRDGAARAAHRTAVSEATKEGTLIPTAVYLAGVGPATLDLQYLVGRDLTLLVSITLALIFLIVALLMRSPVAGLCRGHRRVVLCGGPWRQRAHLAHLLLTNCTGR